MRTSEMSVGSMSRLPIPHDATTPAVLRPAPLEILLEEPVQLREGHGVGEGVEAALGGDRARRADERAPGDARQRAADADAADAQLGEIADGAARRRHEHV